MDVETYAKKKEQIADIEEAQGLPGYQSLIAEIRRQAALDSAKARDLSLSHAERDGAAGASTALENIAEFHTRQLSSLRSTLAKTPKPPR